MTRKEEVVDSQYIIERVRSDLRNEVYELMTHVGYHALEKQLTEMVLDGQPLYSAIRTYSLNPAIPFEEKNQRKQLFAYMIYRAMNEALGGFHFDRFKSLSTGPLEAARLNDIVQAFNFSEFLESYDSYQYLRQEPDWEPFVESRQFRHLEDAITSSIKKNRVIPGVAKAIGKDVVDALQLSADYGYVRVSDALLQTEFDAPEGTTDYLSLRKVQIEAGGKKCHVLLKRASRNSSRFRLLVTNFGALIRGD